MTTDLKFNAISELMKHVDTLSKPHTVSVDNKHGELLGLRDEQPLLLKLRNAVASNMGGAGNGKPARERVPLNVGAADLYTRITTDIREWYGRETDYDTNHGNPTPEHVLRQWFIRYVNRYRSGDITEFGMLEQIRVVQSWIQNIRDLLDPPFRWPLTAPCPVCGLEWIEAFKTDDPAEIERVRVLNAVERHNIEESYVVCRNPECGRIWRGLLEARSLRIAIDDAEAMKETA